MVLNRNPRWKNWLIVFVLLFGFLYALPNFFGEDPAIQVSALKEAGVNNEARSSIQTALNQAAIPYTFQQQTGDVLIRFNNTNDQLKAFELLSNDLGRDFVVALNLAPAVPKFFQYFGATPMKLGLDLRGGVHFLLQVDLKAAEARQLDSFVETLKSRFREEKIRYRSVTAQNNQLTLRFATEAAQSQAMDLIRREFPGLMLQLEKTSDAFILKGGLTEAEDKRVRDYAIEQSMNTLRNRVNELGVAEALVQRQGLDRIVVELPGVQDTAYAKEILGKTASLQFHMVNYEYDANQYVNTRPPAGTVLYYDREGKPVLFDRKVVLSGDNIIGAQSGFDDMGKPAVFIQLGGNIRQFSRITGENIGKGMGTVFVETRYEDKEINGEVKRVAETMHEVISVANIQSRLGNRFQITNLNSATEARNLALLLRAGALPAPIDYVEERIIGPSLGLENIQKGMISLGVGLGLVLIFMGVYYSVFGVIANIALVLNLFMLLAALSLIGATLSLPGIAAIVLTMGMAVDANVLIFERIREELRNGQTAQSSIEAGFNRAFTTIVDANVTTFIAALALFSIGSGPIKGFAITLILGLITSVFTAVAVSRAIINLMYGGRKLKKLPVGI